MASNNHHTHPYDPELAVSYAPLPDQSHQSHVSPSPLHHFRRPAKVFAAISLSTLFLLSLISTLLLGTPQPPQSDVINANLDKPDAPSSSVSPRTLNPISTGVSYGVSEKTFREVSGANDIYPWTNAMLSWQRTAFHFQPEKNWMNGNFRLITLHVPKVNLFLFCFIIIIIYSKIPCFLNVKWIYEYTTDSSFFLLFLRQLCVWWGNLVLSSATDPDGMLISC